MDKLAPVLKLLTKSFGVYNIRGFYIEPTYWEAGAIVILLFLLIITFARVRFLYLHWSLGKQSISFLFWGFFLAVIVEGFLILSGRTIFTEVLGLKNVPKPISTIMDIARNKMVAVMGVSTEIPASIAQVKPTYQSIIQDVQSLSVSDKTKLLNAICKP